MRRWIYLLFVYAVLTEVLPAAQRDMYMSEFSHPLASFAIACVGGLLAFRLLVYIKARSIPAPKDFRLFVLFFGGVIIAVYVVIPLLSWSGPLTGIASLYAIPAWHAAILYIDLVRVALYAIAALVVFVCELPPVWAVVPEKGREDLPMPNSQSSIDVSSRQSI